MKRSLLLLALSGALSVAPSAFAHGGWGHGGGGHGGGYGHHGGSRGWVGPVLGAALLGTAIYAATAPRVVYAQPMAMPAPPLVGDPPRVAYYCNTYQQYYPNVSTCPVPWQVVTY